MLPHDCEGTQRLELPVSRMTLNSWGGVPMVMSEKSAGNQLYVSMEFTEGPSRVGMSRMATYTARS